MKMDKTGLAAAALLAGLITQPASASIPPLIAPVVLSSDKSAAAITHAYLEFLTRNGHFVIVDAPLAGWEAAACLGGKGMATSCLRQKIREKPVDKQAQPVALLVARAEGDSYRWTCVGAGEQAGDIARQSILIDPKEGMFGDGPARADMHKKAVGCLFSAAAEAEGVIRQ